MRSARDLESHMQAKMKIDCESKKQDFPNLKTRTGNPFREGNKEKEQKLVKSLQVAICQIFVKAY